MSSGPRSKVIKTEFTKTDKRTNRTSRKIKICKDFVNGLDSPSVPPLPQYGSTDHRELFNVLLVSSVLLCLGFPVCRYVTSITST